MSDAEIKFWERYAELLNKDGVVGKNGSYTILRAQEFAFSLGGKRLKAIEEKDVEQILDERLSSMKVEFEPKAIDALKRLRKLTRTRNMAILFLRSLSSFAVKFLIAALPRQAFVFKTMGIG